MERRVTATPCIKKDLQLEVGEGGREGGGGDRDGWCLPSDTLTTCQSDSSLLRSAGRGVPGRQSFPSACDGAGISMRQESGALMSGGN